MELTKYIKLQKELDSYIAERHPLMYGTSRIREKLLALIIEIAEMANELPEEFKYWSTKKNNMDNAVEEFVDVLHFLLSIGLEMEYEEELERIKIYTHPITIREQTLHLFVETGKFIENPTPYNYVRVFEEFIALGRLLGFTNEIIETAYNKKNAVNFKRQDNDY